MARAIGAEEFGLLFVDAARTGVEAVGINTLAAAAWAFVENGQNALACCGRNAAAERTAANPSMKNCWLDLMGNRGIRWVFLIQK